MIMSAKYALAALAACVGVSIIATATAQTFQDISACQIRYGQQLGAATSANERCAAINVLVDCLHDIENTTTIEDTQINSTIAVAQLAENCTEYNANRDLVAPEITLGNGNIDISVGKGKDVTFYRKQPDLTTSIWTLADELDAITDQVQTQACVEPSVLDNAKLSIMNAFEAKVDSAKAEATSQLSQLAATLQQLASNIEANSEARVGGLQDDLDEAVADATSALSVAISTQASRFASIAGDVSTQLNTGSGSLNTAATAAENRITSFGQTVTAGVTAAQNKVDAALNNARSKLAAVQNEADQLDGSIKQFIASEVTRTSGYVYTHYGRRDCPGGATKIYQGVFYGVHHGHSGSDGSICLPENPQGGSETGTSSLDLLYGLSVDHNHGTNLPRTRAIPCARCHIRKPTCFRVDARVDCPKGSDVIYTGWLTGAHYSHAGPNDRRCISDAMEAIYSNIGDYVYVSRI
jgi:hypothetical protein